MDAPASTPAAETPVDPWTGALPMDPEDCASLDAGARRRFEQGRAAIGVRRSGWAARAPRCPHAPFVTGLGLLEVWQQPDTLPYEMDAAGLARFEEVRTRRRVDVAAALMRMQVELDRRGLSLPTELWPVRLGVKASQGALDAAREVLREGLATGRVSLLDGRWMGACLELLGHDAAEGLRVLGDASAHGDRRRDRSEAPLGYVRAALLDRLGEPGAARAAIVEAQRLDRSGDALRRLLRFLPIHEALYIRAIIQQYTARTHTLTLRLWDAYLARPEVAAPERALARWHRANLAPRPTYPD